MNKNFKCAMPLLNTRVAPRCMFSSSVLFAEINNGKVVSQKTITVDKLDEYRWLELLLDHEVSVIVCGGVSDDMIKLLNDYDIQVICNVAGDTDEILQALAAGKLHPWFGYGRRDTDLYEIDKVSEDVVSSPCQEDLQSSHACSCEERKRFLTKTQQSYFKNIPEDKSQISFSLLSYSPVCKISQLRENLKEQGYKRVGIIYCSFLCDLAVHVIDELITEMDVISFECPADCSKDDHKLCCPVSQAETVKNENCDVVINLGMCDIFYSVFNSFVKRPFMQVMPSGADEIKGNGFSQSI
jgi:predicted Fe-Mo cluster-binding NifX family protein/uncharacterized metal-binding protein